MENESLSTLLEIISQGGTIAVLAWIVVGAVREWWFTGPAYRRLEAEKNEWKQLALGAIDTADKAVTMVEKP